MKGSAAKDPQGDNQTGVLYHALNEAKIWVQLKTCLLCLNSSYVGADPSRAVKAVHRNTQMY